MFENFRQEEQSDGQAETNPGRRPRRTGTGDAGGGQTVRPQRGAARPRPERRQPRGGGASPKTEIKLKKDSLRLLYKDIAPNHPIILNESPLLSNYRNKMEYSFGDEVKNGPLMLGLHKKNRFYEITDTYNCNIAPKDFDTVRQRVLEYFKDKNSTFFHKKTKIGFLRHLVLRYSFKQREIMLNLVTTSQDKLNEEEFLKILEKLPLNSTISNVIHTINDRDSDVVICDKMKILKGSGFIYEEINGLTFKISPFSFFQPNIKTAELIYKKASEFIGDIKDKKAY